MNGFLYFFPDVLSNDLDISKYDLAHLHGLNLNRGECKSGPGDRPGAIRSFGTMSCGYYPDRQTWIKAGDIYIGYETKPTPQDLLRRDAKGFWCDTLLGKFIVSPVRFLPRVVSLNNAGEVEYTPKDEYQAVAALAQEVLAETLEYYSQGNMPEDIQAKHIQLAIEALSVNYIIGRLECNALGILDDESIHKINRAIMDIDALLQMSSKKKVEGS